MRSFRPAAHVVKSGTGRVALVCLVMLVAAFMSALTLLQPKPALAVCGISGGDNDVHKWTGASENVTSIQGVKADIWNYNTRPVFQTTSIWVMLTKNMTNPDRWAQVG